MKTITEYLNESRQGDIAEKKSQKYILKYHGDNALEFKHNAESDDWEFDDDYDNWEAGEYVTFKYIRNSESLFVTYSLRRKDNYKGIDSLNDEMLKTFKIIERSEYYKN